MDYLYLDTWLTEDQMIIPNYLKGIEKVSSSLTFHTNAGVRHTQKGYLGGTAFWLDEHGITNVISLKTLEKTSTSTTTARQKEEPLYVRCQKERSHS